MATARRKFEMLLTAQDHTAAAFASVDRRLSNMERAAHRFTQIFQVAFGAGVAGGIIKNIAEAGVKMQGFEIQMKHATGSAEAGRRELEFVTRTAHDLGLALESSARGYARLSAAARGTELQGQATRDVFEGTAEAARALNLSASETESALRAFEQMISKGTVQSQELKIQLGNVLPGAFNLAAKAMNVSTRELSKMLDQGKLATSDFLPKMARQMQETFGPAAQEAAGGAAAQFQRLSASLFELKVSIADSGLLSALSSLAEFGAHAFEGWGHIINGDFGFGAQADALEKQIQSLIKFRETLQTTQKIAKEDSEGNGLLGKLVNKVTGRDPEALRRQIDSVTQAIELLKKKQLEILTGSSKTPEGVLAPIDASSIPDKKNPRDVYKDVLAEYRSISRSTETELEKYRRIKADFDSAIQAGVLDKGAAQQALERAFPLKEIELDVKHLTPTVQKEFDRMSVFAEQAARNMQGALADFFIHPFETGLSGLAQSFAQTLENMAAQAASAAILEKIFAPFAGGSGFLASIAKGLAGRAGGGDVMPGQAYWVGEKGPELAVFGARGTIVPNHALGGGTVVEVHNYSGGQARTEQGSRPDGRSVTRIIIDPLVQDLAERGPFARAFERNYGLRPALGTRG